MEVVVADQHIGNHLLGRVSVDIYGPLAASDLRCDRVPGRSSRLDAADVVVFHDDVAYVGCIVYRLGRQEDPCRHRPGDFVLAYGDIPRSGYSDAAAPILISKVITSDQEVAESGFTN